MTSTHRQLQRAADTICGTLPHLWRPEWEHVHTLGLAGLLADIYAPYGVLAVAVEAWWDDPSREGWDIPAHHPDEISARAGWDVTDSLGWSDPLLPASLCRHWVGQLAERLTWWRLAPHAVAVCDRLETGRPPARTDLERILAEFVDAGQTDGTIAVSEDGRPKKCPDSDTYPLTFEKLGISKQQVAEARDVA